jgi:hypothetical protein
VSGGTIPAERLYWARLPGGDGGATPQARRFRFERVVPVPVEGLQVVEQRLDDGTWLLVGAAHEELARWLATASGAGEAPLRLVPDRIPAHLGPVTVEAAGLNLLVGAFTPPAVQRELKRLRWTVAAAVATVMALLAIGTLHRGLRLMGDSDRLALRRTRLLAEAVHDLPGPALPEARLTMALRRLEQQAHDEGGGASRPEAWEVLEAVLAVWPESIPVQIETLTATSERCVIRGTVAGLADADRLAKALTGGSATALGTLRADPLQVQQDGSRSVFVLTLVVAPP